MKKQTILSVLFISTFALAACGQKKNDLPQKQDETVESEKDVVTKEIDGDFASLEEILKAMESEMETKIGDFTKTYESLKTDVTTFDDMNSNYEQFTSYFTTMETESLSLFFTYEQYYAAYFKMALETCEDKDTLDDAVDEFYDTVYGDLFETYYDEVYDGLYEDYYDDFYQDVLDTGRDTLPYEKYSDFSSTVYEDYSNSRSTIYNQYSDAHSLCYMIYSNMNSAVYSGERNFDTIMEQVQKDLDQKAADEKRISEQVEYTIEYEVRDGKAYVIGISGEGNYAEISSEYEGYKVRGIDASVFEGSNVITINCWADLEYIGDAAFKDCAELIEFTIPSETTVIGNSAFENCTKLAALHMYGDSSIGERAFANCTSLTEISIGSETKKVCDNAFDGCTSLESAYAWGDKTLIGKNAFANCPKLEDAPEESGISITLDPEENPGQKKTESAKKTTTKEDNKKTNDSQKDKNTQASNNIRPEFQKSMDEFVAFFEEYCAFMEEYKNGKPSLDMLTKYNEMLDQYSKTMASLNEVDDGTLSKEELKLYNDTMTKINNMIIDAM